MRYSTKLRISQRLIRLNEIVNLICLFCISSVIVCVIATRNTINYQIYHKARSYNTVHTSMIKKMIIVSVNLSCTVFT